MAYDEQIDKITERELNPALREKITLSYSHIRNTSMHISEAERARWNSAYNRPNATQNEAGLMSAEDKKKLDHIEDEANHYSHPKSGAKFGVYTQVRVDELGHVIEGLNPDRLNVNCLDAQTLEGYSSSEFAKTSSPVFLGIPQCPTPDGENLFQITNVNYIQNKLKELEESIIQQLTSINTEISNINIKVNELCNK